MSLQGVKFVMINNQKYEITEGMANNLQEIKDAVVSMDIDPAVANADPVIEGDTVVFKYRAGTKGAEIKQVVVDGRTYDIEEGMYSDPKQIQDALIESGVHPNLANAEYVINGDTMTFRYKAGTKGC